MLSYIERHPERWDILEELGAAANRGEIRLVTSTWTVAEVSYTEGEKHQVTPEDGEEVISGFWDSRIIELAELDEFTASKARGYARESWRKRRSIKPKDAVHLATATVLGARVLFSYDDRLRRKAEALTLPFDVCPPDLLYLPRVSRPEIAESPRQLLLNGETRLP